MGAFNYFLISCLVVLGSILTCIKAPSVIITLLRDKCPGYNEESLAVFNDIQYSLKNHKTYITAEAEILKDFPADIKMEFFVTRCKSKETLDTCETYRSYKLRKVCRLFYSDKLPWANFVRDFNVTCPYKKGKFFINNGTIDPGNFPQWSKGYWRTKTVIRDDKTGDFIFCCYLEFQIL